MIERIVTVSTAASSYDLTSVSAVKSELGITVSTYDSLIAGYISVESARISAICNRVIPQETVSEQIRLDHRYDFVTLSRAPIGTVTSVTVDDTVLSASDYEIDSDTGTLYALDGSSGRAQWDCNKIVIIYQGGYSIIPFSLADACVQLVKQRYLSRLRDPSLRSVTIEGVASEDYWVGAVNEGVLPPDVESVLSPYVRQGFR